MKNWIKYARFEEKHAYIASSRRIYERGVEYYGDENMDEKMLVAFAKFEEGQREVRYFPEVIKFGIILPMNRASVKYPYHKPYGHMAYCFNPFSSNHYDMCRTGPNVEKTQKSMFYLVFDVIIYCASIKPL